MGVSGVLGITGGGAVLLSGSTGFVGGFTGGAAGAGI